MRTIHKQTLSHGTNRVLMNRHDKVIHVEAQFDTVTMWYEHSTEDPIQEDRKYLVVGTGESIPDFGLTYLGMAQIDKGLLIQHVYKVG